MRTELQRQQSKINGAKSRGPSPTGREVSKFNGLKHGLRAEQVVLPGESQDEFEAERQAWLDDWRPQSHTRAVLVERAAVASWRLRRAVRSEAAFYARLADDAGRGFDADVAARVDRAIDRFEDDPRAALSLLESHAAGLDRLLVSWGGLVEALEAGPAGWDQPLYHQRLMILLGHRADAVTLEAGPVPFASGRLLRVHVPAPGGRTVPLSTAEAGAAFEAVRRTVESEVARLRDLRVRAADPAEGRRQAMEAAATDTSKEAQLRHRYEMAHEQSLRSSLRQLLALEKSGADLPEATEAGPCPAGSPPAPPPQHEPPPADAPPRESATAPAPPPPGTPAPGSLGAHGSGPAPAPGVAPVGGPKPPDRTAAAVARGRTAR